MRASFIARTVGSSSDCSFCASFFFSSCSASVGDDDFPFSLADAPASAAADWTLDEALRSKLAVLAQLLGLSSSRWTPAGMLGWVLAGCGGGQMDAHPFFAELVKASRAAHREELLARAGSLF